MKLSKRLNNIVDMCPYSDIIVDVGCDHGYISINLINKKKCKKCYAIDINEKPLNTAIKNIKIFGLEDKISCILSNGFDFLKDNEKVSSVIAGMGGLTTVEILRNNRSKVNNMDYILIQPNAYSKDIRKYIFEENIHIEKEDVVFCGGLYYEYILIFPKRQGIFDKHKQKFLIEFGYDIPTCIIENTGGKYNQYINWRISKYEKILSELCKNNLSKSDKYINFSNKIEILKGWLK